MAKTMKPTSSPSTRKPSLTEAAQPERPHHQTPLSPTERAALQRRLEVLNFELIRLKASLSETTEYRSTYLISAGEGVLQYHLPAGFMEAAEYLHFEAFNAFHSRDELGALVTVRMVEALLEAALAPENATYQPRAWPDARVGIALYSVEVHLMRTVKLGEL